MFINLSYSLSPLLNVKSKSMQVISKAPSAMASFSCSSRVCVLSLPIFSLSCYFDLILDPTAFSFFGHFELISGIFCSILIFFLKKKIGRSDFSLGLGGGGGRCWVSVVLEGELFILSLYLRFFFIFLIFGLSVGGIDDLGFRFCFVLFLISDLI